MKREAALAMFATLCSCTPGGMLGSQTGGSPGGGQVTRIDVNLTLHSSPSQLPQGSAAGYSPAQTMVSVGTFVQFVNSDGFAHTATGIVGANSFPASSPFSVNAQTQSGDAVSASWSSGVLQAGQSSQLIRIDAPGTYLYGCFFHYGAPMRGAIVAQ
jgi:plastocyanin